MARIGLKNLYYAKLTKDDTTGVTYETPVRIPGLIVATVKPDSKSTTLYADDGPAEVASSLGEITVEVETKDLPIKYQAALLGHTVSNGIMVSSADDEAPYVAIMFEGRKANKATKYVKLLKGKFGIPEDNYETKKDGINFQTDKITGKFVCRTFDNKWKYTAETDAEDYVATIATNWYTAVEPT